MTVVELEQYLALIEAERERRPAEAALADEIHRLRSTLASDHPPIVRVHPGDDLLILVPSNTGPDQAERVRGLMRDRFPGNEVSILACDGLAVVEQEPHRCDSPGLAPESPNTASNPGGRYQDTRRTGEGE